MVLILRITGDLEDKTRKSQLVKSFAYNARYLLEALLLQRLVWDLGLLAPALHPTSNREPAFLSFTGKQ